MSKLQPNSRLSSFHRPVVLAILLVSFASMLTGCGGGDEVASTAESNTDSSPNDLSSSVSGELAAVSRDLDESGDLTATSNDDLTLGSADLRAESDPTPPKPPAKLLRQQNFQSKFSDGDVKMSWRAKVYSDNTSEKHGRYVEFYEGGQEFVRGEFADNKRTGQWSYFNKDGSVAKEGSYSNGQLHDKWTYYRKNGDKVREAEYEEGIKHGTWNYYSTDGKMVIRELSFVDGKMSGLAKQWHANGQLSLEVDFVNDLIHGQRRRWYDTGEKQSIEHYKEGKRHGKSTSWTVDGKIVGDVEFDEDKRVASK